MIKYRNRITESFSNIHTGYHLVSTLRARGVAPDLPPVELPPGVEPVPFIFNIRSTTEATDSIYLTFKPPIDDSPWSVRDDDNNVELANSDGYLHEGVSWWQGDRGYSEVTIGFDSTLRTYSVHGAIDLFNPSIYPDYTYDRETGVYSTAVEVNILQWSNQIRRYEMRMEATGLIVPETIPSHITSFCQMFFGCTNFNQDISMWDVSNVIDFSYMFLDCEAFNSPLNNWNISSAITLEQICCNCTNFNQPVNLWNTSNVIYMNAAFNSCYAFNQDLSGWDVSNVIDMGGLLGWCALFDQDITMWDTSNVAIMAGLFQGCAAFNQPIGIWNVSNVKSMASMFRRARIFNQDISQWNTSKVVDMTSMFSEATIFNQPLNTWNVSSVIGMNGMFAGITGYNQPVNLWNTGKVVDMRSMFKNNTIFNQDISMWNVGNVKQMDYMFQGSTAFNQDLSQWCMTNLISRPTEFDYRQYPYMQATQWTLPRPVWGTCPRGELPVTVPGYADRIEFTITSETEHATFDGVQVISDGSWKKYEIYRDDVLIASDTIYNNDVTAAAWNVGFIFTIHRNPAGTVNYKIYCSNRQTVGFAQRNNGASQAIPLSLNVINLPTFDINTISFNTYKLNLTVSAPLPTSTRRCTNMFMNCTAFNSSLAHWDVSRIIDMENMFNNCVNFNQDLSGWNVSGVTSMYNMFYGCVNFNQPLSSWNVGNVQRMSGMFEGCTSFNQDLSQWCALSESVLPWNFDAGTTAWLLPKPVWGTCPSIPGFKFSFKPNETYPQNLIITIKGGLPNWLLLDGVTGARLMDSTGYTTLNSTVVDKPYYGESIITIVHDTTDLHTYELVCSKDAVKLTYVGTASVRDIGTSLPEATITVTGYSRNIKSYSFSAGFSELIVPSVLPNHVTSTANMFSGSYLFNQDISMWDVSRVTDMTGMFLDCASFNKPLILWNTSAVTDMASTFYKCIRFNQPLHNWTTTSVTDMSEMFYGCTVFNQNLSPWNVTLMDRKPWDFDGGVEVWILPKPIWGTNGGILPSTI